MNVWEGGGGGGVFFGHLSVFTNIITHHRVLLGGYLEPSKSLARNVIPPFKNARQREKITINRAFASFVVEIC